MKYIDHYMILGKAFYLGYEKGSFVIDTFDYGYRVRILSADSAITWGELKSAAANYLRETGQLMGA